MDHLQKCLYRPLVKIFSVDHPQKFMCGSLILISLWIIRRNFLQVSRRNFSKDHLQKLFFCESLTEFFFFVDHLQKFFYRPLVDIFSVDHPQKFLCGSLVKIFLWIICRNFSVDHSQKFFARQPQKFFYGSLTEIISLWITYRILFFFFFFFFFHGSPAEISL